MSRFPLVFLLGVLAACGAPSTERPSVTSSAMAPNRALHDLFDREWEHDLAESPIWASGIGERRFDTRWDDVSLAATQRRALHDREVLAEIERFPRAGLSPDDALSLELFRQRYAMAVEGARFRPWLFPINQRGGIQTADELADDLTFTTPKHFADWNERLRTFPTYVAQTIEVLREAIKAGMTHPAIAMKRVPAQIEAQLVTDPTKSGFYSPYKKGGAPPELEAQAKKLILENVVPAYASLKKVFEAEYLPACKKDVGAWNLPDGEAMYAFLVREHTTTKMTPDEVHALGLKEVARIRGEMETVKQRAGFSGSLAEFFRFLRTDPRFFEKTGPALLARYRDVAKRIDPELVKAFKRLPRTPYGVLPIPDNIAPDTTTAYYREPSSDGARAGTFFVNLYKPETRPTWEMMALAMHESVPGHHLQIALALEQEDIPKFRRHGDYTAYIEGWALYAESLGDEMGLYDDPYSKFGQLAYEMWRAVRLVVDTGIHHLHWDRDRAIAFFMESSPKTELDVVNEIDRYIAWPGQALAYKIGELEIKKLRQQTAGKLDEKTFHDVVLRHGALPLDVLEMEVMKEAAR
jgi:uncharacterized protein (DUF885 family)